MKTTLNKIKSHYPSTPSLKDLLDKLDKTEVDDTEVSIKYILDSSGLAEALWTLRAVDGYTCEIKLLGCSYAEHVLQQFEKEYPNDNRPRKAIEIAKRYANGEAKIEELRAATRDAKDAAWEAAWQLELLYSSESSNIYKKRDAKQAAKYAAVAALEASKSCINDITKISWFSMSANPNEYHWQREQLEALLKQYNDEKD